MEVVVNDLAKEKLKERGLEDKYMKVYYEAGGWSGGLQMDFEDEIIEEVGEEYKLYEVDGYKIRINKDLLDEYDYMEIKYANNFIQQGFYPSKLRPEE